MSKFTKDKDKDPVFDAAHQPVMSGGSAFDEFVAHRVEAFVKLYDVEPDATMDAMNVAYRAGLRAAHAARKAGDRLDLVAVYRAGLRDGATTLGELAASDPAAGIDL